MGPEATAPPHLQSRRAVRERATSPTPVVGSDLDVDIETDADVDIDSAPLRDAPEPAPTASVATRPAGPLALTWVDHSTVVAPPAPDDLAVSTAAPRAGRDLLATAPRRTIWRPGVLIPAGFLAFVAAVYAAITLLWPLHAIAPEVDATAVQPVAAEVATPAWPTDGGAALAIGGMGATMTSSTDPVSIASITKVVTALVVLDEMPLARGEAGPDFAFTAADRIRYWADRAAGESALDVPVGGTLTQYQMLEGLLIGSANNYADRLSSEIFPSEAVFADAARSWLSARGITGISIVEPSGILPGNAATPESLIPLAQTALENPVIAEIVAKTAIDLPGAGRVENTNPLLGDPGVVGLKTGTLDSYNLLAAKDVIVGDTTVRLYGSMLGQPNRDARDAAMRALFADAEQELELQPSVAAGTRVGEVVTRWGEPVDIVTSTDAAVVLWNGNSAAASTEFSLGEAVDAGATVGTLTLAGPVDTDTVELELAGEIEAPTTWWRLTHPLEILGLN